MPTNVVAACTAFVLCSKQYYEASKASNDRYNRFGQVDQYCVMLRIVAEYVIFRLKYAKIRVFGALGEVRIKYETQYVRPDSNTGGLPKNTKSAPSRI